MCDPSEAIFDPACRTPRRTHAEVAYGGGGGSSAADCANGGACGYGVYRGVAGNGCEFVPLWNAWKCRFGFGLGLGC